MKMEQLKIKINVIWDKNFNDGEILCEMFYRYFCSGDISVFPNTPFSIAVRSYPLTTFKKRFNNISDYLTVNILLAEDYLAYDDPKRMLANNIEARNNETLLYIPIALSKAGCDYIDKAECITAYQGEKDIKTHLNQDKKIDDIRKLLNGEYKSYLQLILRRSLERISGRYLKLVDDTNTEKVKLFICHTKSTGLEVLNFLKCLLTLFTNSLFFVDKNSIELGENLNSKIFTDIEKSALLVVLTDDFSTREWCLKEIKHAKENNRPIIIIDAINNIDTRLYPYIGNCPIVRLNLKKCADYSFMWIYEVLLSELLQNLYNLHKNKYDDSYKVLSKKIELFDFTCLNPKVKTIIYPEPPLSITEKETINKICQFGNNKIKYTTEISEQTNRYKNLKPKIMISSSANPELQRIDGHCCCVGINHAVTEICRYLIYMGCTILNAGNYSSTDFNIAMLDLLKQYTKFGDIQSQYVFYVNGYIKRNNEATHIDFANRYKDVNLTFKYVSENATTNAEALSLVRNEITTDTDLQIVIGGMYDSNVSGLEKEVGLCISKHKPIYLLGGFGFKTKQLCETYLTREKYALLNNGLSLYDNKKLANQYDVGNILKLIFKGYQNHLSQNK